MIVSLLVGSAVIAVQTRELAFVEGQPSMANGSLSQTRAMAAHARRPTRTIARARHPVMKCPLDDASLLFILPSAL